MEKKEAFAGEGGRCAESPQRVSTAGMMIYNAAYFWGEESYVSRLSYLTEQRLHEKRMIFWFNFTFNPDTPFGIKEKPGTGEGRNSKSKKG